MRDRPAILAEAIAGAIVSGLALTIAAAYIWAGLAPLAPFALLGFALATTVVLLRALTRRAALGPETLLTFLAVVVGIAGWLLWLSHPSYLPPGKGGDLTHHLQLVDYLERHWRLPDAGMAAVMGEMAHYTPGFHLLAALGGAWTRSDGFHAAYPLLCALVALKAGFVFLIAMRSLPDGVPEVPIALSGVVLVMMPHAYFLGSFVQDSFLAQAAAELFAVAMWWALVTWDQEPRNTPAVLFAIAGVGTFLTWPIWIGPPIVALLAAVLTREDQSFRLRARVALLATGPILLAAVVHSAGRAGWLGMAGATGAVLRPSIGAFGWPFLVLSLLGVIVSVWHRQTRGTLLLLLAIAVQAATLWAVARRRGADAPYMALKMMYLAIYPLAVVGAVAVGTVWRGAARALTSRGLKAPASQPAIAWMLILVTLVVLHRPLFAIPKPSPVVSDDLYAAGRWARAHIEAACIDYLVAHADTAYWLHLAVLGNPRVSTRTADPDTFDPARNMARWIEPGGLPYAIADLRILPNEVRSTVDVVSEFGRAAVLARPSGAYCAESQRLAQLPILGLQIDD